MIRFPFYWVGDSEHLMNGSTARVIAFDFSPRPKGGMLFIAAPKDFVEKPTIKMQQEDIDYSSYSSMFDNRINDRTELANHILSGVQGYANVTFTRCGERKQRTLQSSVTSNCVMP